jgi:hypothetical protein
MAQRLLLGLLLLPASCSGLMLQSHAVTSQWDTWAFAENGTYYAYYLITEHSPGEGFGVATSTDGQHWTDHGYVWHGPSWVNHRWWEGTGSVWRAADFNKTGRYVINYSQCPSKGSVGSGGQNITFAESFDLINWRQKSDNGFVQSYFDIDTRYYEDPGRWDCIFSIPLPNATGGNGLRDGYPRYGFWTASPKVGTMGFGITRNGWDWEALPSPEMHPVIKAEVGAVEYFPGSHGSKGKWFAILGHGGMVTYSADSPEGPYYAATKNYAVLTGNCYFARFFRGVNQSEVLVTHQAFSHAGHTYIAPYKVADVDAEGTLRFKWWHQNEGLKGPPLSAPLATAVNVSEGVVLEATSVVLPAAPPAAGKELEELPGFILGIAGTERVSYVAVTHAGGCIVGEIASANATGAPGRYQVRRPLRPF